MTQQAVEEMILCVLRRIREEKKTGALTLNFSQGSYSGEPKWDGKLPIRLTTVPRLD